MGLSRWLWAFDVVCLDAGGDGGIVGDFVRAKTLEGWEELCAGLLGSTWGIANFDVGSEIMAAIHHHVCRPRFRGNDLIMSPYI